MREFLPLTIAGVLLGLLAFGFIEMVFYLSSWGTLALMGGVVTFFVVLTFVAYFIEKRVE